MEPDTSCKNFSLNDRLYNRIKSRFVELVNPRQLLNDLAMPLADEERVLEVVNEHGRHEGARELLRLLTQQSDWCDHLIRVLRIPQVGFSFFADEIEDARNEVMMVVDIEMSPVADIDMQDPELEYMDVDPPDNGSPSSLSEEDKLKIFREIVSRTLHDLVQNRDQMKTALSCFTQLNEALFVGAVCGCLELYFRVQSLESLHVLRALYKGGALRDALSRGILTPSIRRRLRREAAVKNLHINSMRLTLRISEEDFLECERILSNADISIPRGFVAARTTPVQPFSEQSDVKLQLLLNKLPLMYQRFLEGVIDLTLDLSVERETALFWAAEPVCDMVKDCMQRLHEHFKTDETVKKDLIKIGLYLLIRSVVHKKKNVNTVSVQQGDNVCKIIWQKEEKAFLAEQRGIPEEYRNDMILSSVEWLLSEGWLVEVFSGAAVAGTSRFSVPLSLYRDYIVCYLLPTHLQNLSLRLFLDPDDSLDNTTDLSLFYFASIFLPYICCYSEIEATVPDRMLYFPDAALFLSSVHAHEQSKEVKDRLDAIHEQFEFPSFLNIQTSPDVDSHWKTWKTIAVNLGCDHIEMVNRTSLDESAFKSKISVIENSLNIGHGNVISVTPESDIRLTLRSVALLDLLPSVMEEPVFVAEGPQAFAASKTSTQGDTSSVELLTTDPSLTSEKSVEMRTKSSAPHSHARLSQRFSGSSEEEKRLLQKEGCLSLDNQKVSGDYRSRRASDWSFNLNLTKYIFDKKRVSVLCHFLPQLDHVTHLSFNNTGLNTPMIQQILDALNPDSVKGLSFVGCTLQPGDEQIGFDKMAKVEFLDLEDTGITDSFCSTLVREIGTLKHLKEINVGCNRITHTGFTVLASTLSSKMNLRALRVHANKLGEVGAAVLAQLVFSLRNLEILSLWGCALGDEGVTILSDQFPVHKNLKRLSIRDNNTSFVGSSRLYRNLSSCKDMQFIDCNENTSISVEQSDFVSTSILNMLKASSSWNHVSFWNCNIGQLTIFEDPLDLSCLSGVTYLCLQKNGLTDDSIKSLSICIEKHLKYLQHLNLRENLVADEGSHCLAKALVDKKYLEDLWLDWNIFGHDGAKNLIQLALELPNMKSIDLSFSFQLSPPEREHLASMVGDRVWDGDLYTAMKGQLLLRI